MVPGIKTLCLSITLLRRMKTSTIFLRNERLGSSLPWLPKESCTFTQASEFHLDRSGGSLPPKALLTFHSKAPTAIPEDTPFPARPIKWPVPIFEAKRKAPIWKSKDSYRSELLPNSKNQFSQMWPQTEFHSSSKEITPWAESPFVFFLY